MNGEWNMLSTDTDAPRASMLRAVPASLLDRLPFGLGRRLHETFCQESLKSRALRGSFITTAAYVGSQGLSLLSNLILTRLLFPGAFGLMSLVNVFMQGLNMFSDIGIGPAIIQNKHGDEPEFLNTAWTLQVIRGGVLFLGSCAMAFPLAAFYDEPLLAQVIPVSGCTALLAGFSPTKRFSANRKLELGRVTGIQLIAQTTGLLIMVVLTYVLRSVWALVVGGVLTEALKIGLMHWWLPGIRNSFCWNPEIVRRLLRFGRWIFLSTVLSFVAMQGDRISLGKLLTLEALGIYSIAYLISSQPRAILSRLGPLIIFPAISLRKHLPRHELRQTIQRYRWPVLLLMAFGLSILTAFGDLLILWLWDERYAPAAQMLPLLALGVWPRVLDQSSGAALMAIGKLQYNSFGSIGRIVMIFLVMPLAFAQWGVIGAVAVIAASDIPNYLADLLGLSLNGLGQIWQDSLATMCFLAFLVIEGIVRVGFGLNIPVVF